MSVMRKSFWDPFFRQFFVRNVKTLQWGSEIQTTVGIWNQTILIPEAFEIRTFWRSDFKWSGFSYGMSQTFENWTIQNSDIFVRISNGFWQNGGHLTRFLMVGHPDFRPHSKSGPFATQPLLDHWKSKLGWISDPHCILDFEWSKRGWVANGPDFRMGSEIQKPCQLKSRQKCPDFEWSDF